MSKALEPFTVSCGFQSDNAGAFVVVSLRPVHKSGASQNSNFAALLPKRRNEVTVERRNSPAKIGGVFRRYEQEFQRHFSFKNMPSQIRIRPWSARYDLDAPGINPASTVKSSAFLASRNGRGSWPKICSATE